MTRATTAALIMDGLTRARKDVYDLTRANEEMRRTVGGSALIRQEINNYRDALAAISWSEDIEQIHQIANEGLKGRHSEVD